MDKCCTKCQREVDGRWQYSLRPPNPPGFIHVQALRRSGDLVTCMNGITASDVTIANDPLPPNLKYPALKHARIIVDCQDEVFIDLQHEEKRILNMYTSHGMVYPVGKRWFNLDLVDDNIAKLIREALVKFDISKHIDPIDAELEVKKNIEDLWRNL